MKATKCRECGKSLRNGHTICEDCYETEEGSFELEMREVETLYGNRGNEKDS